MKMLGIAIAVLGILVLIYGGFSSSREKTVVDLGPIEATATEQKSIPLSPIFGMIALVGGVVLLMARRKQLNPAN